MKNIEIGEKIFFARKKKKLSQTDFGNMLGVSLQTISRWETGATEVPISSLEKIAQILDEPISYFFNPSLREPQVPYLSAEIMEALQDPTAVKALLAVHKGNEDIKAAIQHAIECLPNMDPVKRNAILALCR